METRNAVGLFGDDDDEGWVGRYSSYYNELPNAYNSLRSGIYWKSFLLSVNKGKS